MLEYIALAIVLAAALAIATIAIELLQSHNRTKRYRHNRIALRLAGHTAGAPYH